MAMQDTGGGSKPAGDVTRTRLGSIGPEVDEALGCWFDFGDDWWHQINVVDIQPEALSGTYPSVTKRVGASPPQLDDWDEEEEDDSCRPRVRKLGFHSRHGKPRRHHFALTVGVVS